jgi:hypothetical protein
MSDKKRHVFVYNKSRETFLAFRVKVADSIVGRFDRQRLQGSGIARAGSAI